ncbi:hypothetical protein [Nocardia goodfellowii]|uniref:Integral membrane protein n=1 Tax=Nocardia goodfellowii TaxID=882446 RepID=A0ABS4QJ10_9NOCA|nr:hypothetical protein [Nocardia goodfellowii]MBP2191699.1 hypothetical protein [Nocardia goodfellowii]
MALLVAAILTGSGTFLWATPLRFSTFLVVVPVHLTTLAGVVTAILLLIGVKKPVVPALGAAVAGMVFSYEFDRVMAYGEWFGVGSVEFLVTLLGAFVGLAALILALVGAMNAMRSGAVAGRPTGSPAPWGQPVMPPQGQWGHPVPPQPPAQQYQPPR